MQLTTLVGNKPSISLHMLYIATRPANGIWNTSDRTLDRATFVNMYQNTSRFTLDTDRQVAAILYDYRGLFFF